LSYIESTTSPVYLRCSNFLARPLLKIHLA
jgi:hypothetical protein